MNINIASYSIFTLSWYTYKCIFFKVSLRLGLFSSIKWIIAYWYCIIVFISTDPPPPQSCSAGKQQITNQGYISPGTCCSYAGLVLPNTYHYCCGCANTVYSFFKTTPSPSRYVCNSEWSFGFCCGRRLAPGPDPKPKFWKEDTYALSNTFIEIGRASCRERV